MVCFFRSTYTSHVKDETDVWGCWCSSCWQHILPTLWLQLYGSWMTELRALTTVNDIKWVEFEMYFFFANIHSKLSFFTPGAIFSPQSGMLCHIQVSVANICWSLLTFSSLKAFPRLQKPWIYIIQFPLHSLTHDIQRALSATSFPYVYPPSGEVWGPLGPCF